MSVIIPGDARLPSPVPTMGGGLTPATPLADKAAMTGGNPPAGFSPKAAFFSQNTVSAGELFKQTAAALKLPADTLNVTLLALSRFFSLPPSQALMTALRRDVLASSDSSPQTAAEKAALEAKAMAAAAALDKGVTLSPEALERYARYLESPSFTEDGEAGGKNAFGGDGKKNPQDREEVPDKDELRAIAEEEAEKDSLLDFLNALPGKNGQYWAIFPFSITVRGAELRVFLRVLKGTPFFAGENEQLIVDIAAPKRQYRCFVKKGNGKLRADIRVYPEVTAKALKSLSKKAGGFLAGAGALAGNMEFEEIVVKNGEETPSWAENWCAECLPSIDKEV